MQKHIQQVKMNGNNKIFCIGSNIESYVALKFLINNKCKIHTLITLPSNKGHLYSDYIDLHEFCDINNINVIDTTNVNSKETIEKIKKLNPDFLFTLGWNQIFKEEFISCFSQFIVGTHPSLLPYGRGRAPVSWTISEGVKQSAVSFFKTDLSDSEIEELTKNVSNKSVGSHLRIFSKKDINKLNTILKQTLNKLNYN